MIKCPNCSGDLKFKETDQVVKCEYCKSTFNPEELIAKVSHAKEEDTFEGKCYTCSQCGGTLLAFEETAVTFCSYCGSQAMIESKMIKINNPEYIIPFKKSKDECIDAYKKLISKAFFAPSYMKSEMTVSKFRGIYMPYCVYKLAFHGSTTNKGSKYSHRSGDYVYYNDYSITADVDADYEGIAYDLRSNFYDKFSGAIPYNFNDAKSFNHNYLLGYYADVSDVDKTIYNKDALDLVKQDTTKRLAKYREFSKYGCSNPTVNLNVVDYKNAMYPVYFLAIRSKNNQKIHYAVINGQTGEVAADIPIDFKKYIFFSLLLSIPVFLLINFTLVVVPKKVCFFSMLMSILSMIICLYQVNAIKKREEHLDDLGYKSKFSNIKAKSKTFVYIYKQIITIIIGAIVMAKDFASDAYYYGASILMFVIVILTFKDLVILHNKLVSSKLPQLEKRGGDRDE